MAAFDLLINNLLKLTATLLPLIALTRVSTHFPLTWSSLARSFIHSHNLLICFGLFGLVFEDRVSLHGSPGWPITHDPPAGIIEMYQHAQLHPNFYSHFSLTHSFTYSST
jgi:hypothetical protein